MEPETIPNYVGGTWIPAASGQSRPVCGPATGEVLAHVSLSGDVDVDRAVTVAAAAFDTWREVPAVQRARLLFRFKALLDDHAEDLARTITLEHGKTLDEARGEVRRGIEHVEHACAVPALLMGDRQEDVAAGIDCDTVRHPVGVFAALTPAELPAMAPLGFWPYAVATGNTFIVKPSAEVPLSQKLLFELVHEAGFPAGVVNLVHGDDALADALVRHPGIVGVSLIGSTAAARALYRAAGEHGKRVQAFGGAGNHAVVMADAALERVVPIVADGAFGCTGQRCLAGNRVIAVGDIFEPLLAGLVAAAERIVVGSGLEPGVTMGPLQSGRAYDRACSVIAAAERAGARVVLDGRNVQVKGFPRGAWLGPTILVEGDQQAVPDDAELAGPVLIVRRAGDLDAALALVRASSHASAASLFTASGRVARDFQRRAGVAMVGVNIGVAAPMAFFPFGGSKGSFFGDLKAHGGDALRFFTDARVVISRWF